MALSRGVSGSTNLTLKIKKECLCPQELVVFADLEGKGSQFSYLSASGEEFDLDCLVPGFHMPCPESINLKSFRNKAPKTSPHYCSPLPVYWINISSKVGSSEWILIISSCRKGIPLSNSGISITFSSRLP